MPPAVSTPSSPAASIWRLGPPLLSAINSNKTMTTKIVEKKKIIISLGRSVSISCLFKGNVASQGFAGACTESCMFPQFSFIK